MLKTRWNTWNLSKWLAFVIPPTTVAIAPTRTMILNWKADWIFIKQSPKSLNMSIRSKARERSWRTDESQMTWGQAAQLWALCPPQLVLQGNSSEQQLIPAWCEKKLWCLSQPGKTLFCYENIVGFCLLLPFCCLLLSVFVCHPHLVRVSATIIVIVLSKKSSHSMIAHKR